MSNPQKIIAVALVGQPMSELAAQALQMSRRGERLEMAFKGPMAKLAAEEKERDERTMAVDAIFRGTRSNLGGLDAALTADTDTDAEEIAAISLARERADEVERDLYAVSLAAYKKTSLEQVEREVLAVKESLMVKARGLIAAEAAAAQLAEDEAEKAALEEKEAEESAGFELEVSELEAERLAVEEATPAPATASATLEGAVEVLGSVSVAETVPDPETSGEVTKADLPDGWRDDHWATRKALGDRLAGKDFEDLAAAMVFLNSLEAGE